MNDKIRNLRNTLNSESLDGYIVTTKDEFDSEYPPSYLKRLEYLTDFSCSNGVFVVLQNKLIFFTDNRYLLAAKLELELYEVYNISELKSFQWSSYVKNDAKIGYDSKILTSDFLKYFSGLNLVGQDYNLIDKIWKNRPAPNLSKAYHYDIKYSGLGAIEKINQVRELLKNKSYDALFINSPESVCWLLNIRASDNEFSPVMLSYCYIDSGSVMLFSDNREFGKDSIPPGIEIKNLDELQKFLQKLNKKISVSISARIFIKNSIKTELLIEDEDPILWLRAIKNNTEIEGARNAHREDAGALLEVFSWFSEYKGEINEYELGLKLTEFRSKRMGYLQDSFAAICGFNANGAQIHYRADKNKASKISDGILLIDSGGHYLGGTTDITRTIALGSIVSEEHKKYYTKVLRGHIALAKIKFPKICTGSNLDILARQYLWADLEDYGHGTGHGVGNALSVHEGPMRISLYDKDIKLKEGMILSNEPGFYKDNAFGIRIENLQYIRQCKQNSGFLEFKQLTLVPYCKELILLSEMAKDEIEFLENYYQEIKESLEDIDLTKKAQNYLLSQLDIFK